MARALIVGCGCRGRELGAELLAAGWQVRGTTRRREATAKIEEAGIEPVVADPDAIGTLVEHLDGVSLIFWLLGSATGPREDVAALHGPRLERLLTEIVDTPVRGMVYELTGDLEPEVAAGAIEILRSARERWRIPFEVVESPPGELESWRGAMVASAEALLAA